MPAPPLGWNSWDAYGTTINERQVKANADWMAKHLKAYGWEYITVDMEWFVTDPTPEGNAKDSHLQSIPKVVSCQRSTGSLLLETVPVSSR